MLAYLHQSETGEWRLLGHLDDAGASSRKTKVEISHQLLLSRNGIQNNKTNAGAIFLVIIAEGNYFDSSISIPSSPTDPILKLTFQGVITPTTPTGCLIVTFLNPGIVLGIVSP